MALVAIWVWRGGAERRAVTQMPADQRAEIYSREFENFRALCGDAPRRDVLEKQCRERGEFLLEFPECDEGCERSIRIQNPPVSPR
jgi:hypothetical protein